MKHKLVLGKAILQPTKYLRLSVLLNCFYVKVEDCSALMLIIVRHLTRLTAHYGKKLISYGVSGKVLNVILNTYKSIKSCVMNNGVQSEFFDSHVGLRQGENLSPLLFALFLNDMVTFFPSQKWNTLKFIEKLYNDSNDGINGMLNLFVLLYADDTAIMAENEHDMQRNLDLLNEYCICNKLRVNISKTKMMVFARSKTWIRNIRTLKFGNMDLDEVEDYIYLGICFNWNLLKLKSCYMTKLQRLCIHSYKKAGD